MTVPPEIKRLRNEAAATVVALSLAEQAVRDTEARAAAQVSWLDPPAFVYFCRCGHLGVGENHRCPDPSNEPSIRYAPQGVAGTWPDQSAQHAVLLEQVKDARREAFREAVEALREDAVMEAAMQHDDVAAMQRYAADFLERRFLTGEGESDA